MSKSKTSLAKYLDFLGLLAGLLPAISSIYKSQNIRIMILDNSYSMRKSDASLMRADSDFSRIDKVEGAIRWAELSKFVEFHTKMASRCGMPTQFRLVNEAEDMPKRFSVCWNAKSSAEEANKEREVVISSMNDVRLDQRVNPLARQLKKVEKYLSGEADTLKRNDEFVSVVICTHGIPTDEEGNTGKDVTKEFIDSLSSLAKLPVKIIFRLCTDNDNVVGFFAGVDNKTGSIDVLVDFWGEAMEVYLHNPWLTYGIGLHRIREAGLGTGLMDDLDEHSFTLSDIREFCLELFAGKNQLSLRNPKIDFEGFIEDLQLLVNKEKLVWNPLKNKLCHWVDVDKLRLMYAKTQSKTSVRSNNDPSESGSRIKSRKQAMDTTSLRSSMPDMSKTTPKSVPKRGSDPDFARAYPESVPKRGSEPEFRRSYPGYSKPNGTTTGVNGRSSSGHAPKDHKEYIQHWSHEGPTYKKLKPLEDLLVDIPSLFPPANSFVESHEYYFKWKAFSYDAFSGESGDELKELLRRASRKSKLFFHPDKLPSDLTENQDLLFKSIWNVIMESEAATLQ